MMEDGSGDETDQQRRSICDTNRHTFGFLQSGDQEKVVLATVSPSSTTIAKFPSGERPTQVMFLVVDTGKVSEVLLENRGGEMAFDKDLPHLV